MTSARGGFIGILILLIVGGIAAAGGYYVYEHYIVETDRSPAATQPADMRPASENRSGDVSNAGAAGANEAASGAAGTLNAAAPAAALTVLSPIGGETWSMGTTHRIAWSGSGNNVDIYLDRTFGAPAVCPRSPCEPYARTLLLAANAPGTFFDWTITADSSGVVSMGGGYKVRVCASGKTSTCGASDAAFGVDDPAYENDRAPVIEGISGPTTLGRGQIATFRVAASDPDGDDMFFALAEVLYNGQTVSDGSGYDLAARDKVGFSVSFPEPGAYRLYFRAEDVHRKSDDASHTVYVE